MILRLVDRRPAASGEDSWVREGVRHARARELAGFVGPGDWAVDLVLVDDETMARINREYREAEGITDVLSFSYLLTEGSGRPSLVAGRDQAHCDLWLDGTGAGLTEEGQPVVGEILLATWFVERRCLEKGWPLEIEFALLVVHGCLHILGWEHDRDDEREAMRDLESRILARLDLPHPLR